MTTTAARNPHYPEKFERLHFFYFYSTISLVMQLTAYIYSRTAQVTTVWIGLPEEDSSLFLCSCKTNII